MQVTLEKTGDLEGRVKVEVTQNDYLEIGRASCRERV